MRNSDPPSWLRPEPQAWCRSPRSSAESASAGRRRPGTVHLCLLVTPNGGKYWRLRHRYGGRQKELTVGQRDPRTSLREAVAEAARLRERLAAQADPAEERIATKLAHRDRTITSRTSRSATPSSRRSRRFCERTPSRMRRRTSHAPTCWWMPITPSKALRCGVT